jgi:hypothetical protein
LTVEGIGPKSLDEIKARLADLDIHTPPPPASSAEPVEEKEAVEGEEG